MEKLVTVYPVRQAVWGADRPTIKYFRTAKEREEYLASHDYCDKLRVCKLDMNEHISNNPDGFAWWYEDEKEV